MSTAEDAAYLNEHKSAWVESLWRLLDDAEARLAAARRDLRGPERNVVLADLDAECWRIDAGLTELVGPPDESELVPAPGRGLPLDPAGMAPGVVQLHLSRSDGRIVAWASAHQQRPENHEMVLQRIKALGGVPADWDQQATVKIPGSGRASTVSAPIEKVIGWLAPLGRTADDADVGTSVAWMGCATAVAIKMVAEGRFVPQLVQSKRRRKDPASDHGTFRIRWMPALIDPEVLAGLVRSVPTAAMLGSREQEKEKFTLAALADLTDAIVGFAAGQLETPAAPPEINTRADAAEAAVSHLGGTPFLAPTKAGGELVRRLNQWAFPVLGTVGVRLVVQLDSPDDAGAWHVAVLCPGEEGDLMPVEVAITLASKLNSKIIVAHLSRLERLFPELMRLGGRRRGEVFLSQDEAWRLMTESGDRLRSAGFDVRVPAMRRQKAVASLRLTSEADETVVGAQQLANVRWSAVFDEVELSAAEIAQLAAKARPLVRSRGQWVELDKADLAEAAAALAERADKTRLTGADMLRHALGLEGSPLAGGVNIVGEGWAADLLRSVKNFPDNPTTRPEGFTGELRNYQADALVWLDFLDDAGLGGCLALDMGLGKTPTTLAGLALSTSGTGLVIAPPAVVGNWASEARNFVPDMKVLVHHGANRAKGSALRTAVRAADVVITTYGTAVRDMDQLSEFSWGKVVIDEAQAIKNPLAETSQQLRRLSASSRLALTGTPIENGLGDLWAIMDWANPSLLGPRAQFIAQLTPDKNGSSSQKNGGRSNRRRAEQGGEEVLRALNGILVYRRTKAEPAIAAELPDRIDELDHCPMTPEQIGLYQAVIDSLILKTANREPGTPERKGAVLAAITALKQICNHPLNYQQDDKGVEGRSGKLARLYEILSHVFAADEKALVFTHFASWGEILADHLSRWSGHKISCYHGGLARGARDRLVAEFQGSSGAGAMVLSLKAGGTGLNLTAANHVVLYDRWWNPAVEDQARDRVWRIGQKNTVICHRLVCPGTIDERVEEVVAGKRRIASLTLPKSSSIGDLNADQLQAVLGIDSAALLDVDSDAEIAFAEAPRFPDASEPGEPAASEPGIEKWKAPAP
ncbi:MAG: DEAD/DEAH box helicase [Acidimicrobiaceae bacterium]|nr:DEAD/DEAH box helicase [Acidimicrobiaceae bacterium]